MSLVSAAIALQKQSQETPTASGASEAQKKAGNYKKQHRRISGLDISIENPAGSVRSGTDPDGNEWSIRLQHHYGYMRNTIGKDKDHLDCFLNVGLKPDTKLTHVHIVNQKKPDGSFDEHKVMIGWQSKQDARKAYLSNYEPDWDGIMSIVSMPMQRFKKWSRVPGYTRKPAPPLEKQDYLEKEGQESKPWSDVEVPSKVKGMVKPYLWRAENAQKEGYNPEENTWDTYVDEGHPAVGPGIRVPEHGTYKQKELENLFDRKLKQHYWRMTNNNDYPGINDKSARVQAAFLPREWMSVGYPKAYRAFRNRNWDKFRTEAREGLSDRRWRHWNQMFGKQLKSKYWNR